MKFNGIAHIYITVQDFDLALEFYRPFLAFLEMECLVDSDTLFYCVGGRTGIGIRSASAINKDVAFDQYRAGLHHVCLRAYSREDVDSLFQFLVERSINIISEPHESDWAPGYYSILFEDPCGTRLEMNYVPGKGNLSDEVELPLSKTKQARLSDP